MAGDAGSPGKVPKIAVVAIVSLPSLVYGAQTAVGAREQAARITHSPHLRGRVIAMPELGGKMCLESEGMIKERFGTHEVKVAVIGPAGENLVRFAAINADWSRNAGRTGMGAVMGSKNLKAIVLRGAKDLPVHDLPAMVAESEKAYGYMRNHKYFKMWQREGLMMVMEYASGLGILPTHNFKDATYPKVHKINGDVMLDNHKIGDSACFWASTATPSCFTPTSCATSWDSTPSPPAT